MPNTWFYRGLIRGLGSAERPVVLLSYDYFTRTLTEALQGEGLAVLPVSGVVAVRLDATDVGTSMANAAQNGSGYWLFQYGDFPVGPDAMAPPRHDPPQAYWDALNAVDSRLSTVSEEGG